MTGRGVVDISIAVEDPRLPENAAMIAALDRRMQELYEPESCHLTSPSDLVARNALFLAARIDGAARGCIACVPHADGTAEVKRVWTAPAARGRGVARALLTELVSRARATGISALRLETGPLQPEALGLFRGAGFRERGPFGGYGADPNLIFMEKPLTADAESPA